MMDEQGFAIAGREPRSAAERRLRELFLAYCGALVSPEGMASVLAPDFWPHDLIPGDHRPPAGAGTEAMMGFRAGINSAFTLRSGTGTWIQDDAALSELTPGAEPGAIVGAKTILTYVHDGGPVMLPGSDHGYEPTGREVIVEVDEAVRFNGDGQATDRWNRLDLADLHRQLEQNRKP
jgi:hypothetical protein